MSDGGNRKCRGCVMIRRTGGAAISALMVLMISGCVMLQRPHAPKPIRPQLAIVPIDGGACMPNESWVRLGEYILQLEARP